MRRFHRSEDGQVGGLEAIAFGLLVLIIGVLIISNVWGVIDAKAAAQTAAREAARTFATSPDGDKGAADLVARETLAELGWTSANISVHPEVATFRRCALVTWVVSIPVPVFRLPWMHGGPTGFRASARHTERVDPYRSGVPGNGQGVAQCG